ncbi:MULTISPECIES: STAS domain-containing protein [Actinomadura]|jgi:anti-anti-sigma factor|uniref:Anti-sigma factor antagonist n=2 Tax=Actinomadura TaxID=1988 RepID=A0A239NMP8_9ACTN|nr:MULTISPECIES: STAS domain-containing protein [Actinomadura]SNT55379.1 anti-anti-sigma factor [Actinomadura meyerae]
MTALITIPRPARALARAPDEVRTPARQRPGHTIVALSGALDGAAAPALREHLIGALRRSGRLLILDLGEVASADAAGLAVLVGIRRRAAVLGITLRLVALRPQVAALLRATALDRALAVYPDPDSLSEAPAR